MILIKVIRINRYDYIRYSLPIDEVIHSYRVANTSFRIGYILGLNEIQLRQLFTAALFHDIGKSMISKSILGKRGKLTLEERKEIELHPIYSESYVNNIEELKELSGVVRAHHERWDGKGYPDKLKGKEIPLMARIISIADVYDALKHPRVYRPYGFSNEEIKSIMKKGLDKQFDSEILKVFIEEVFSFL